MISERMNKTSDAGLVSRIKKVDNIGVIVGLLLLFISLSFASDVFLSSRNLLNVFRQSSLMGIAGIGGLVVMVSGGIDLSIGSVMAVGGVATAACMNHYNLPVFPSILIGLIFGMMIGLINGIVITKGKVNPFIGTLGTMLIGEGVVFIYTGSTPISNLPEVFNVIGRGYLGIIPVPVIIMFAIMILFHFILTRTKFGHYLYAVGGNEDAARLCGVRNDNVLIGAYITSALLASTAGIILASRLNSGHPHAGSQFLFPTMTAIILGGVSMSGGIGKVQGVLLGAIFLGFIGNGMNLLGVSSFYQKVFQGVILVVAVLIDNLRHQNE